MFRFKNPLLLMTACVNPNGMAYTAVQDSSIRRRQYLEAIRFYLKRYKYKILFVENTNTDLSVSFEQEIADGRIEFMSFEGNEFDKKLGKGYGEGIILNYALKKSSFIKSSDVIIKVSGRHRLMNLFDLAVKSQVFLGNNSKFIVCEFLPPPIKAVVSDCFIASKSFFKDYLNLELCHCDDSNNIWFEHIFYRCIQLALNDGYQLLYIPTALDQRGVWGSTGSHFKPMPFKTKFHYFLRMLYFKYKGINFLKNKLYSRPDGGV